MKRIIAFLVSLICIFTALQLNIAAIGEDGSPTYGVFEYEVSFGKIHITGCDPDASGHIDIPSEINGITVKYIRYMSFNKCNKITSVTIPSSVAIIGGWNFQGSSLTDVYCEAEYKPSGWESNWVSKSVTVHWGCKAPCYGNHSWSNSCDDQCNVCGKTRTVAHTPGASATCTEDQICTVCYVTITPAHHTPGAAATCTRDQLCLSCNIILEKAGHKLGEWSVVIEPTLEAEGRREQACTVCKEIINSETIPAYMLGDVNFSGEIEKYDYILVKRAAMKTVTLDAAQILAADVNENSEVEKYDYILIKRHCMKTYTIG